MSCPYCQGPSIRKGMRQGAQQLRCTRCGRYHRASYRYAAHAPGTDKRLVALTKEGCGIRSISRLLGISTTTVGSVRAKEALAKCWRTTLRQTSTSTNTWPGLKEVRAATCPTAEPLKSRSPRRRGGHTGLKSTVVDACASRPVDEHRLVVFSRRALLPGAA